MTRTVCLAVMAKNEGAILQRCIDSARPLISHFVLHDTSGSSETSYESPVSFRNGDHLAQVSWVDFGANRSALLKMASKEADWVLMLDADMTVDGDFHTPFPDADALMIRIRDHGHEWRLPLLTRSRSDWEYRGRVHEVLATEHDAPFTTAPYDGIIITHHADGANQEGKLERALELLTLDLADHPKDPRTVFYLAQTLRQLGKTDEAIEMYKDRVVLDGSYDERFYSLLMVGILEPEWYHSVATLLQAHGARPHRGEPVYELAKRLRLEGMPHAVLLVLWAWHTYASKPDDLFINQAVYDWGLQLEWSIALCQTFHWGDARVHHLQLLERILPDEIRECVEVNDRFAREALKIAGGGDDHGAPQEGREEKADVLTAAPA